MTMSPFIYGRALVLGREREGMSWADLFVESGVVSSKREARDMAKQGALYCSVHEGGPGPIQTWTRVRNADEKANVFPRPDEDAYYTGYWFLVSRGKKWSIGHLRPVIILGE